LENKTKIKTKSNFQTFPTSEVLKILVKNKKKGFLIKELKVFSNFLMKNKILFLYIKKLKKE